MGNGTLKISLLASLVLVSALQAGTAMANDPEFLFPLDCKERDDCIISHYPDHDSGPEVRDFACGNNARDQVPNTLISVRSMQNVDRGLTVRAAMDGTVLGLRGGIHDEGPTWRDQDGKPPPFCGNAIEIAHENNTVTRYCHLREASILVSVGDKVKAGDAIGYAGWSGDTPLPGLGFRLLRDGDFLDPYSGSTIPGNCTELSTPLFSNLPRWVRRYDEVVVVDAGFTASPQPLQPDILRGYHRQSTLPVTSPSLVFWVMIANAIPGETRTLQIVGPGNRLVAEQKNIARDKDDIALIYTGKARPDGDWPKGEYTATLVIAREVNEKMHRINKIYSVVIE